MTAERTGPGAPSARKRAPTKPQARPNGHDDGPAVLRVPPHSLEAEQGLLGGLLLDNGAWLQVADVVQASDFFRHEHQLIYAALSSLLAAGEPVDVVTLAARLDAAGQAREIGGVDYLNSLAQFVPSSARMRQYAEIVRARSQQRHAIALADELASAEFAGDEAAAHRAEAAIVALRQSRGRENGAGLLASAVDLQAIASAPQAPPRFVIDQWLPAGYVTLLAAHGEAGKSQIALYLAICLAAGLPVLGAAARSPMRVLFYSCEDRALVMSWRIQQYCQALGIEPALLEGQLIVIDAADLDGCELYVCEHGNSITGKVTPSYEELRTIMKARAVDVLVIDNASDAYAASEIGRAAVRGFIRALQRLLPVREDGAVLLLGHVSRAASNSRFKGDQYSGSTSWHNAVRSRWEISRKPTGGGADEAADEAVGDDTLEPSAPYILTRAKANYAGRERCSERFVWNHRHLVILPDEAPGPMVQAIDERNAAKLVLRAMADAEETGTRISANTKARNNASKVLPDFAPDLPKRLRQMDRLTPVLRRLHGEGLVCIEEYTGSNRTRYQAWSLTERGRSEART